MKKRREGSALDGLEDEEGLIKKHDYKFNSAYRKRGDVRAERA